MNKFYLGRLGELLTIQYLKAKGYKLLIHSYKRAHGEIDLIMQDKDVLVFIEVKTRSSKYFGEPIESVTMHKIQKIRFTAKQFLIEKDIHNKEVRFAVVEVKLYQGKNAKFRHIRNAF